MDKPGSGMPVSVTGIILYEDRTFDESGFTGLDLLPVRRALVEIVREEDQEILTAGTTGEDGSYNLTFTNTQIAGVYVRVLAEESDLTVKVKDQDGNLYSIRSSVLDDSSASSLIVHLTAEIGDAGGVFNILDVFSEASRFVSRLAGEVPPAVSAIWSPGSCNGTFLAAPGDSIHILGGM